MSSATASRPRRTPPSAQVATRAHLPVHRNGTILLSPAASLQAVAENLGAQCLTSVVYDEHRTPAMPSSQQIVQVVGSWCRACELAGLTANRRGRPLTPVTAASAKRDLQRCARACGPRLRASDYTRWAAENGRHSLHALRQFFGTWDAATAAADLGPYRTARAEPNELLDARVRDTLADLHDAGTYPSMTRFNAARRPGTPVAHRLSNHHGSWPAVLAYYDA